jgi:hypothetical protein
MNVFTAAHVCFAQRDNVVYDDLGNFSRAHADIDAGARSGDSQAGGTEIAWDRSDPAVTGIIYYVGLLGGIQLVELRAGTAQPDLTGRGVD